VAEDARSNNFEEKMKADPVAVAVVLSGLNQPFDLSLGQVLRVRRSLLGAARVNCANPFFPNGIILNLPLMCPLILAA
jgi:hypothetical protein